jgi:hypothetical protein
VLPASQPEPHFLSLLQKHGITSLEFSITLLFAQDKAGMPSRALEF